MIVVMSCLVLILYIIEGLGLNLADLKSILIYEL